MIFFCTRPKSQWMLHVSRLAMWCLAHHFASVSRSERVIVSLKMTGDIGRSRRHGSASPVIGGEPSCRNDPQSDVLLPAPLEKCGINVDAERRRGSKGKYSAINAPIQVLIEIRPLASSCLKHGRVLTAFKKSFFILILGREQPDERRQLRRCPVYVRSPWCVVL